MVRHANESDIPALVAMGRPFAEYSAIPAEYSPRHTESMLRLLMQTGAVLVEEEAGAIRGSLWGLMAPLWFTASRVAAEMALWVVPEHRGQGVAAILINAFEQWGKENGASYVSMTDLSIGGSYPAGEMFDRLGYVVTERARIKEVR